MAGDDLPCDPALLHAGQVVADIVYHPLRHGAAARGRGRGRDAGRRLGHARPPGGAAAAVVARRPPRHPGHDGRRGTGTRRALASSLARMLRYLTAGESHGQALVVIVEGLPAGLEITVEEIQAEMARRRLGYGRGPAAALRAGRADAASAVSATAARSVRRWRSRSRTASGSAATSGTRRCRPLPAPRRTRSPRSAPVTPTSSGMQKYGFTDARDVLERASARETAAGSPPAHSPRSCSPRSASRSSRTSSRWVRSAATAGIRPDARRPGRGRRVRGPLLRRSPPATR